MDNIHDHYLLPCELYRFVQQVSSDLLSPLFLLDQVHRFAGSPDSSGDLRNSHCLYLSSMPLRVCECTSMQKDRLFEFAEVLSGFLSIHVLSSACAHGRDEQIVGLDVQILRSER